MSVTVNKNECEKNCQYLTDPLNLKAFLEAYHSVIILVTAQAFTPFLLPLMSCQCQAPLKTGGKTKEFRLSLMLQVLESVLCC